jgi:hypothetical protein
MNTPTKLALVFLVGCALGLAMLVYGLFPVWHFRAVVLGGVWAPVCAMLFAAVWRSRP